jgi:CRP-like cAMP-binding protein
MGLAPSRTLSHPSGHESTQNLLLAQFPKDIYRNIAEELEPVTLQLGQTLYHVGDRMGHLYFPNKSAMLSLLCISDDDNAVEVAVTGWEGFVGFGTLMGAEFATHQVICQMTGSAVRIKAGVMRKLADNRPEIRSLLLRYVQALIGQISQTALCNRIHSVEERLARWTLVSQDRTETQQLPLTHEFLARMLGVNRSTVSLTAATLQRAGVIRYVRGKFTILDRKQLEEISCDCYRIVREQYNQLGILREP